MEAFEARIQETRNIWAAQFGFTSKKAKIAEADGPAYLQINIILR